MKRLFTAIKIVPSTDLLHSIEEIKIKIGLEKIKWANTGNLHLTLKFFGDTPEDEIPKISDTIKETLHSFAPFSCNLSGLGIFGSRYNPRVIWIGFNESDTLVNLGEKLLNNLDRCGFPRDRQNFVPHLTLGRIKIIQNKSRLENVIIEHQNTLFQKVEVNRIVLYESIFKNKVVQHIKVNEFFISSIGI